MSKAGHSYHSGILCLLFLILVAIGMANLYSAGAGTTYFDAQLKHLGIGLVSFVLFGWIVPIRHVNTYAYLFFGVIFLCVVFVLFLGHSAGGGQRWIILGPLRFQPSEMAKLAMAIGVAKYFYHNRSVHAYSLFEIWPVLLMSLGVFVLIFKQPDLGTAGVCLIIAMCQLLFIRIHISIRTILVIVTSCVVGSVLGWSFFLRPYQKLRILNLIDPNFDPMGSGYNAAQSLVAIGSGRQFGKGFLQGTQTQLQFLPARHTDFIFSVFAEEHGFWGCAFVFFVFISLAYVALEIARDSRDSFNALLAIGIAAIIAAEFTINVAMVLGIFPVVGMPLPFFSYGGSALLTMCISTGLLLAIDRENAKGSTSRRLEAI